MNRKKHNPFTFGHPVEGEDYFSRPELESAVMTCLENRIHVVIIGPRRYGKTSLVWNILKKFERQGVACLFVDIFNITSHRDFLNQIVRALKSKKSWYELFRDVMGLLPKLRPRISAEIDPLTGQPSMGLSLDSSSDEDAKEMIQDVLSQLERRGDQVIFAIDELQKIADINDGGWLEATLRIYMQQLRNTSCLFTGSRRHIIYDMLNNRARPLYNSCQSIEIPSFNGAFTDWIMEKFASIDMVCERTAIAHLRKLVDDVPNYVQTVCFHLAAHHFSRITVKEVETILDLVIDQKNYTYQAVLNSLNSIQQRSLRLLAIHGHLLSATVLPQDCLLLAYEIPSPLAFHSAVQELKDKGLLDDERSGKGQVIFDDPLLAIWLKKVFQED